MIDFVKTKGFTLDHKELSKVEWTEKINTVTGEIHGLSGKSNGLTIYKKMGTDVFIMKGSLHKFYTGGIHNYSNFGSNECKCTVERICGLLRKEPNDILLENVEFGLNIIVRNHPEEYLGALVMHKTRPFLNYSLDRHPKTVGLVCKHQQYLIKAYLKSAPHNPPNPLLRYEISVHRMKFFGDRGLHIRSLEDLCNPTTMQQLGDILISSLDNMLVIDQNYQDSHIPYIDKHLIDAFNRRATGPLVPQAKNYDGGNDDLKYRQDRKAYYQNRKRIIPVLNKHGLLSCHNELKESTKNKVSELVTS